MNSGYICVPLLCMLDLLYSNMVGLLSHNEITDPCKGAKYDLYVSYPREKQALRREPGTRNKGLRLERVDSLTSCCVS